MAAPLRLIEIDQHTLETQTSFQGLAPRSLPIPDCLNPPVGIIMSPLRPYRFIHTVPAAIRRIARNACPMSLV